MNTSAESAYMFRHALVRDAAYQLQLPSERARLHALAFHLTEKAFGGRAPEPPAFDRSEPLSFKPHPTDNVAAELAWHAKLAVMDAPDSETKVTPELLKLYLYRTARHAAKLYRHDEAITAWQDLEHLLDGAAKVKALIELGSLHLMTGRIRQARHLYEQVLDTLGDADNRSTKYLVLCNLALALQYGGYLEQAEQNLQQALAIQREDEGLELEVLALQGLANIYQETWRLELAEDTYKQVLTIYRKGEKRAGEGLSLCNLALNYLKAGRKEVARQTCEDALRLIRELEHRPYEGVALGNLALIYQNSDLNKFAVSMYEQALTIHREVGNRRSEGIDLGNMAGVYLQIGQLGQAERIYRQALAMHQEVGNRFMEGAHKCDFGLCLLTQGRHEEAVLMWQNGASILRESGREHELQRKTDQMRQRCADANVPPLDEDGTQAMGA
jgi:tetratricopeptide (TPR) repeat protein